MSRRTCMNTVLDTEASATKEDAKTASEIEQDLEKG